MQYGLEIGSIVRLVNEPDWGVGQIQSIIGDRITINFEHMGKVVLQGAHAELELIMKQGR